VSAALISEPAIADEVAAATEPVRDAWTVRGPLRPRRPGAGPRRAALFRRGVRGGARPPEPTPPPWTTSPPFVDRYVARGRCPADDRLESYHRGGALVPAPEGVVHAWN